MVAVVGSANLDLVFRASRLPKPGETIMGLSFSTHPGGKGANQAVAIGKLGGAVSFVGAIGDDANGIALRSSLVTAGVDVSSLSVVSGISSGTALILVDEVGMNSIVVVPGANGLVSALSVRSALEVIQPSVTLAQLEIPLAAVEAAAGFGKFILNPAPARELSGELLTKCWAITPNETETEALTGIFPSDKHSCRQAAHRLLDKGVSNVIITLGESGCFWASPSEERHFEAFPVQAIDTTAAGDAFNGALAHFLDDGKELGSAIELANKVAALSTTKAGAQESMPNLQELDKLS